jgi:hypothetical protein
MRVAKNVLGTIQESVRVTSSFDLIVCADLSRDGACLESGELQRTLQHRDGADEEATANRGRRDMGTDVVDCHKHQPNISQTVPMRSTE